MVRTLACLLALPVVVQAAVTPAAEVTHPVFSFIDNRLLAHVQRGGGVLAIAGSANFAKYLNGGRPSLPWKLRQKVDGHQVAVSEPISRVSLPLGPDQTAGTLYVRVKSSKARELEAEINGRTVGRAQVASGWQTAKIPVPPGTTRAGENDVQLSWSGKGDAPAVEWIQLGGDAAPDTAPSSYDGTSRSLVIPQGGGLAWYVMVPDRAQIVADVGGEACEVVVRGRAQNRPALDGVLRGAGAHVSLAGLSGSVARIDLATRGCPEARLANAVLVIPGPAPQVVRGAKPKHIVFWIMDSLRADKVRPFFPGARAEVPNWEKLAKTSTLFLNAYVQGNESRVSHASIWSSLYAVNHKMIHNRDVLDARWITLGEAMKAAGLYTAGVSANGWIIQKWGFGDGWDYFFNHIHADAGTRGEDVWAAAKKAIGGRAQNPFFLYMGMVDTHVSWRAHEPWISRYDREPYSGPFKRAATDPEVDAIAIGKMKISERDKTRIIALYDSDVSYQDDLIAKVTDQLSAWGIADDTMIVITADHGDELWEDGRLGHGGSLRETLVHVPLLIHYPPLFLPGAVEEGVDDIDILPTLMDALGQAPGADMQGESLLGLSQGVGRGYPRPSISSQYEDAYAMRLGGWKIILRAGGRPQVYDAVNDHLERNDLADSRAFERRFLTDALSTFLVYQKEWKKRRWGVASNHSAWFAEDVDR